MKRATQIFAITVSHAQFYSHVRSSPSRHVSPRFVRKPTRILAILALVVLLAGVILAEAQQFNFTTLAGSAGGPGHSDGLGSAANFYQPSGVAVDGSGNVYVADTYNKTIRKVTPAGIVTTLAGLAGTPGSADGTTTTRGQGSKDGTGNDARFNTPYGVAVDGVGNLYVTDPFNNTIRKGHPALMILNSGSGFGFNGGQFGFILTGPVGQSVVIEASTDLVSWRPIWTNSFAGALSFSVSQSIASSNLFYRAHLP